MGQVDKAGQEYIQHPLRVMQSVQHPHAKICAVLHDILEDTPTTIKELTMVGVEPNVIDAIVAVTKMKGENRFQAVQRTVKHAIACEVKLADLQDNMDLSRLPEISKKDLKRYAQYQQVYAILQAAYGIHQHINSLKLDQNYPEFVYGSLNFNFQYLLNAEFDHVHPMGGDHIESPQEWWILFEDVSQYLSYCKRKIVNPKLKQFLQLVNATDREFFGSAFQTQADQRVLIQVYEKFIQQHFSKSLI